MAPTGDAWRHLTEFTYHICNNAVTWWLCLVSSVEAPTLEAYRGSKFDSRCRWAWNKQPSFGVGEIGNGKHCWRLLLLLEMAEQVRICRRAGNTIWSHSARTLPWALWRWSVIKRRCSRPTSFATFTSVIERSCAYNQQSLRSFVVYY